jgi:Fusaric acid resistance protein-like
VVGTVAVLLLSPKPPGNKLRARAAQTATALAAYLEAAVGGTATAAHREAVLADRHELKTAFASGPIRPTGLATTDQALANVVELLQWSATLTCDALDGHLDLTHAAAQDRELLAAAASQLTATAALLGGQDPSLDVDRVRRASAASAAHQQKLAGDPAEVRAAAALAAHAQSIAVAAQAVLADALITSGKASPDLVEAERRRWYGLPGRAGPRRGSGLARAAGFLARHASLRSVWFRNSARGSVAIAAAVAVASLSGVEHGFWVALGTLSVLRTTAASTGSTAFRALLGTAVGFVAGALLLLAIGTGPAALWTVLPFAVFIASYAPGTAPFAVGQAAFTVTIVVIFNLLAPAGWQVGLLRIEDVAIGCAVSLVVGAAFWPRGAAAIVGDDLADAFRQGGRYLTQAVDWALGLRRRPPESAVAAVNAGARLDEALRAYLAEQGTKRLATEDLWALIMGTARLRLTAYAVASLPASGNGSHEQVRSDADPDLVAFRRQTADLASFYDRLAAQVGPPGHAPPAKEVLAAPDGPDYPNGVACAGNTPPRYRPDMLWVGEHLYHLAERGQAITEPAEKVAEARQLPWWR